METRTGTTSPHGNTSEMTDPNGAVVNSYTYDPFGLILSKTETVKNLFEFAGEYGTSAETNNLVLVRTWLLGPGGAVEFTRPHGASWRLTPTST